MDRKKKLCKILHKCENSKNLNQKGMFCHIFHVFKENICHVLKRKSFESIFGWIPTWTFRKGGIFSMRFRTFWIG
jgi:hypothetical protein